jgi:hypothetical protein
MMVTGSADLEPSVVHLGLARPVARQLRTSLSPSSTSVMKGRGPLRALIVGDPGDPARDEALPGARREALAMAALLAPIGLVPVVVPDAVGTPDPIETERLMRRAKMGEDMEAGAPATTARRRRSGAR